MGPPFHNIFIVTDQRSQGDCLEQELNTMKKKMRGAPSATFSTWVMGPYNIVQQVQIPMTHGVVVRFTAVYTLFHPLFFQWLTP